MHSSARRVAAITLLLVISVGASIAGAQGGSPEETKRKLKSLQDQMDALRKQLEEVKAAPPPVPLEPAQPVAVAPPPARPSWISDFKIGGYGSTRFEASDLDNVNNTFTFRRFVLTGDATIGERLRGVVELELERLTNLEVERKAPAEGGRRGFLQAIEGSDKSEISLEQAWVQFVLADWAKFRTGMILVPLGRFNINHDDNRWDLPRRSLVDRGVPVLPSQAAWSEVGAGFTGDIPTQRAGTFSYQVYAMNGVTLDASIETIARGKGELETEVEIRARRGTGNIDLKRDKAGALRIAWSPSIGQEIGVSSYYGRYTPDFLPSEPIWAFGLDGKFTLGRFEAEGEYVHTQFSGIRRVARGFARSVSERSIETGLTPLNTTIEFDLAQLADTKQGYWLEARYRFWPDVLSRTILGRRLDNPQLIATARWEQVWLDGLVRRTEITGAAVSRLLRDNLQLNRATIGLAYRPIPLVVFQTAYERTGTDAESLSIATNFLPAKSFEDTSNAFLFGAAFGF